MQKPWQTHLSQLLTDGRRTAILGIGSELYGDDAFGMVLVRQLKAALPVPAHWLLLEAGPAPENVLGALRGFHPDVVLLVDAAHLGGEPGDIMLLGWEQIDDISASSHTLPFTVMAHYLTEQYRCDVALLGVQPASTTLGASLSTEVQAALEQITSSLGEVAATTCG